MDRTNSTRAFPSDRRSVSTLRGVSCTKADTIPHHDLPNPQDLLNAGTSPLKLKRNPYRPEKSPIKLKDVSKKFSLPKLQLSDKLLNQHKYSGIIDTITSRTYDRPIVDTLDSKRKIDLSPTVSFNRLPPIPISSRDLTLSHSISPSPQIDRVSHQLSSQKLDTIIDDCLKFEKYFPRLKHQLTHMKSRIRRRFDVVRENSDSPKAAFRKSYMDGIVREFRKEKKGFIYGKKFRGEYMTNLQEA